MTLKYQYVVATDIISRGIDIDGISHIINVRIAGRPRILRSSQRPDGTDGERRRMHLAVRLFQRRHLSRPNSKPKGLHPVYRATRPTASSSKPRNATNGRVDPGPSVDAIKVRKIVGNQPTKIKPGYKKKFKEEVVQATKKLARKARDR
ncbi:MAG: hypothetical protein MZU97_04025 [Bacillus subtilis]|nr:hypothetical protein [Bacillus subtilis]